MRDLIARIDAVTADRCGVCDRVLGPDDPSRDFCSQEHQELWHARRVTPLQAPRPAGAVFFDGEPVGSFEGALEFRPGLDEAEAASSWWSGVSAQLETTIRVDEPGEYELSAVLSPGVQRRGTTAAEVEAARRVSEMLGPFVRELRSAFDEMTRQLAPAVEAFRQAAETLSSRGSQARDVMAEALEARRTRNTGPARRVRAPRRLDRK